jgi:hypothetical protein
MAGMPAVVPYGPHEVSTKTEMGKHLWSMERKPNYNPEAPENIYPRMLYKAYEVDGTIKCMDTVPRSYLYPNQEMYRMAVEAVEQFNTSCQRTVGLIPEQGQAEQLEAEAEGWRTSPQAAKQVLEDLHKAVTKAAMERAYQDKNMSEKARVEIAAAEAETPDQLGEIKEKPKVKLDGRSKEAKALKAAGNA